MAVLDHCASHYELRAAQPAVHDVCKRFWISSSAERSLRVIFLCLFHVIVPEVMVAVL